MALMALLARTRQKAHHDRRRRLVRRGLIYGDGAITPAISVLSALEGLSILTNSFDPYIVPDDGCASSSFFFLSNRGAQSKIGKMFGPIMAVWFVAIGVLGLWGIAQNPSVLAALNPAYGVRYLFQAAAPLFSFSVRCFFASREPRRFTRIWAISAAVPSSSRGRSWFLPCLVLNYAGQTALVLNGSPIGREHLLCALSGQAFLRPSSFSPLSRQLSPANPSSRARSR